MLSTSVRPSQGPSDSHSPSGLAWNSQKTTRALPASRNLLGLFSGASQERISYAGRFMNRGPRAPGRAESLRGRRARSLGRRRPAEVWLRWCAHGVKPAADVHLGVGLTAVVPGSGRIGGFGIPSVHRKLGISTLNHKPVGGIAGHDSTDFASELLHVVMSSFPIAMAGFLYFGVEACRGFGVSTVNSPTCSFFTAPRRWAA